MNQTYNHTSNRLIYKCKTFLSKLMMEPKEKQLELFSLIPKQRHEKKFQTKVSEKALFKLFYLLVFLEIQLSSYILFTWNSLYSLFFVLFFSWLLTLLFQDRLFIIEFMNSKTKKLIAIYECLLNYYLIFHI